MMLKSLAVVLAISGRALAQTTDMDSSIIAPPQDYSPSMAGIIIKLLLSMILIIGLIYFTTFLIKKINNRAVGGGSIGDAIKIIGRTHLSPKQALYMVRIGKRYVVLGATESAISMISKLNEQETEKFEQRDQKPATDSQGMKFGDILKGIIRQ